MGRAGPRRTNRAVSATMALVVSRVETATAVAGGSESHRTPDNAAVSGEESGGSTYQSPDCPLVCQTSRDTWTEAVRLCVRSGSPITTTSRAAEAARFRSAFATGARVAASRQRPRSVSTNIFTGTRATSLSALARKRDSQSGGEARITAAGSWLTSTTNSRLSSRGSASPTPSRRTWSTVHPGDGIRETGNVTSVKTEVTFPVSRIDRKSTRLNSSHTVISYAVFCLKKKNKK